ncbi:hypothetical protein BD414DRAFT_540530 [Trametes punicea]|nr:hypothetical protein BD414DRAFT_540530 [Trametes punicea]
MSHPDLARCPFASPNGVSVVRKSSIESKDKSIIRRRVNCRNCRAKDAEALADQDRADVDRADEVPRMGTETRTTQDTDAPSADQERADHGDLSRDDGPLADVDQRADVNLTGPDVDITVADGGTQDVDLTQDRIAKKRKEVEGRTETEDEVRRSKKMRMEDEAVASAGAGGEEETDQHDYRDIFRRMIKLLKGDKSEEEEIQRQEEAMRAAAKAVTSEEDAQAATGTSEKQNIQQEVDAETVATRRATTVGAEVSGGGQRTNKGKDDMWEWCLIEDVSADEVHLANDFREMRDDGRGKWELGGELQEALLDDLDVANVQPDQWNDLAQDDQQRDHAPDVRESQGLGECEDILPMLFLMHGPRIHAGLKRKAEQLNADKENKLEEIAPFENSIMRLGPAFVDESHDALCGLFRQCECRTSSHDEHHRVSHHGRTEIPLRELERRCRQLHTDYALDLIRDEPVRKRSKPSYLVEISSPQQMRERAQGTEAELQNLKVAQQTAAEKVARRYDFAFDREKQSAQLRPSHDQKSVAVDLVKKEKERHGCTLR